MGGFFSECTKCPADRLSPRLGSTNVADCVSPAPNFSIGFISLAMCILIAITHLAYDRFCDLSFQRKEKIVKEIANIALKTNRKIKDFVKYHDAVRPLQVGMLSCERI